MAGLNQFKELVVKILATVCVLTTCKRLEGLGSGLGSPVVVTKKKKTISGISGTNYWILLTSTALE